MSFLSLASLYFFRLHGHTNSTEIKIADLCTNSTTGLNYSQNLLQSKCSDISSWLGSKQSILILTYG